MTKLERWKKNVTNSVTLPARIEPKDLRLRFAVRAGQSVYMQDGSREVVPVNAHAVSVFAFVPRVRR